MGVLGGCLIAAMGVVLGVRMWKKKLSRQWAEAVRERSRKRTVILLRGIIEETGDAAAASDTDRRLKGRGWKCWKKRGK